ncbi:MAG: hypothetical protein K2J89_03280 [Clostridia bacterium]|nr:hypothetical protein [Clostridia bacterium]
MATTAQAVKVGIGPKVALLRPAGRNSTANSNALIVNSSGYVNNGNVHNTNGVRPAFPQSISAEKAQAGDGFKENVASKGKRGFIPFREWRKNTWPTARRTPKRFSRREGEFSRRSKRETFI